MKSNIINLDDFCKFRKEGADYLRDYADQIERGEIQCMAFAAVKVDPSDIVSIHGSYVNAPDLFGLLGAVSYLERGVQQRILDAEHD